MFPLPTSSWLALVGWGNCETINQEMRHETSLTRPPTDRASDVGEHSWGVLITQCLSTGQATVPFKSNDRQEIRDRPLPGCLSEPFETKMRTMRPLTSAGESLRLSRGGLEELLRRQTHARPSARSASRGPHSTNSPRESAANIASEQGGRSILRVPVDVIAEAIVGISEGALREGAHERDRARVRGQRDLRQPRHALAAPPLAPRVADRGTA